MKTWLPFLAAIIIVTALGMAAYAGSTSAMADTFCTDPSCGDG